VKTLGAVRADACESLRSKLLWLQGGGKASGRTTHAPRLKSGDFPAVCSSRS
jgi:hypothetical protein